MTKADKSRPLRVALFSGNYNYVKDGANQALNRLVGRMLERGIDVRVYSPVVEEPAFPATGTLVGVPSVPIPGRGEYRVALGLPLTVRADLKKFRPDIVHLSAPDWLGHDAKRWGRAKGLPVVASVHTRFETYFDYYKMGFIRRGAERLLKSFYGDLDEIYAPSESMADVLRQEGYSEKVRIWSRGVDRHIFRPEARDMDWRRSLGIDDATPVIGFVGRLVLEKGLDIVAAAVAELGQRNVPHQLLVVGQGPAREEFEAQVPGAAFVGFQTGDALGRAYASSDMFLNPSVTETFGNVTLEAMACAVPPVAAAATGASSLVVDGVSGRLVAPGDVGAFADALEAYARDPGLRARHGAASLERAKAFDWDAINDAVIDRYLVLTGRG
ncbi:glycosyltransferase family 4 protein [Sandaracinobacteroides hominis]|uniref:glycosyltransferase family 4 protein n=1 Tax=Sandaracinobacteroides hominis TaxID=2780086 RepID=UPI0018F38D8E|nr:glycosyltransferase family 1 protein [Sandaracinobacteroides hominis]